MSELAKVKIGTRPFFYPMHRQPVFLSKEWYIEAKYPVSENLAERGFYLPSGLGLTSDDQVFVVNQLKLIVNSI